MLPKGKQVAQQKKCIMTYNDLTQVGREHREAFSILRKAGSTADWAQRISF